MNREKAGGWGVGGRGQVPAIACQGEEQELCWNCFKSLSVSAHWMCEGHMTANPASSGDAPFPCGLG